MKYTKVQKHTTAKIVTSGYDDRYLKFDSTITISVIGADDRTAECQFQSNNDALGFLFALGVDFDEAWSVVDGASVTKTMSARLPDNSYRSTNVTPNQMRSVQAFLAVRNPGGRTQDSIDKNIEWLNSHPLPETLLQIVQAQISACDRLNTEMWGNPNGRAA